MARDSSATRMRLLCAADTIAAEHGAAGVSLDAVAAKAGVSKGGLLYHFPTKAALLRALVEHHIESFEARLKSAESAQKNATLHTLLEVFAQDWASKTPRSGLLAALAEDPAMLNPVSAFQTRLRKQICAEATDPLFATLAFHAMQGLRTDRLLGIESPPEEEIAALVDAIRARL